MANVDYFQEALACIQHVDELTSGGPEQLHHQQCRYLSSKVSQSGDFLQSEAEKFREIAGVDDIRRKALRHLHFAVKRAEMLVRSCKFKTWLEAAVTLTNIKEDIVDILLDLQWWTSMVGIAIAAATCVSFGQKMELDLVTTAEKDLEDLRAQFLPGGQAAIELDDKVAFDKEVLLNRVREVQSGYADKPHDRQYCLAAHVQSRLEDIDVTHSMADVELNAYETKGLLGSGSCGAVMMVKWLGRDCALKTLRYSCTKEATILSGFQHPHIVQFFRYWEASLSICSGSSSASTPVTTDAASSPKSTSSVMEQTNFLSKSHILMEHLPLDLAAHIALSKGKVSLKRSATGSLQAPLPQDVAIDLMLQLTKAMVHSNSKDVAHRDLKPGNVLVRPVSSEDARELGEHGYVRVKLGDFGLAKPSAQSTAASSIQSGHVGSTLYGAPEVFNQDLILEKRFPRKADVWSYGIMFSEVLTGNQPFIGIPRESLNEVVKRGTRPELPNACPEYLKFIIEHCWKYKQEDRPNFLDLWKLLRYAQVRSLGLIREDHQLFTFTTRQGEVQQLHKRFGGEVSDCGLDSIRVAVKLSPSGGFEGMANVDYFQEALACIQRVSKLTSERPDQLHHHQCRYLSSKVSQTGEFLQTRTRKLRGIAGVDDIRRKALRHLHFAVKRAEMLVRSCSCEFETWLEAAVTLTNIKEDIVDILLDVQWWTSIVGITIASVLSVSLGQKIELELITAAEKEFEKLLAELVPTDPTLNELNKAVAIDKKELLKRVREVQSRYASKTHDHEYLVATHVRSRLEDNDVTQCMADVELNVHEPGEVLGSGSFGVVMIAKWLGRNCALKKLRSTCTKEATSLSTFQHPHIVQFFRYWEASQSLPHGSSGATTPVTSDAAPSPEGTSSTEQIDLPSKSHILMELLPLDLEKHMRVLANVKPKAGSKRPATGSEPDGQAALSEEVAIDVMLQLAKAMWHLNSKKVAHRDLKPNNCLMRHLSKDDAPELAERGYLRLKLGDFGFAKTKAQSVAYSTQTKVGCKIYDAPEVFNKEKISKKRFPRKADVWSYGMMFSEVLSGKRPYKGFTMVNLGNEFERGTRPELPKALPEYLKFIIEHCWKYKQEYRPNFMDLWNMLRYAQVRSLGLIRFDHQLFTFTTQEGVVQRLHRPPPTGKDLTKPSTLWVILGRLALLFARRREFINQERFRFRPGPSMARLDDKPLGYMVNEVGAPEAGASTTNTLDVIFFEGNVGERKFLSCKDTWVQRGKPNVWWPRDWLVKEFKGEIRVLVLQYDISDNGVGSVVDDLQRYLVFSDLWNRKEKWDRPIVLVGHSLGCVVIEQLVVALNQKATSIDSVRDEFDGNRAKLSKAFLTSVAGCFFYAPPYTGLVPHESLLKEVFGGLTFSPELFADLYVSSSKLQKLSEEFMDATSERVHLMALYEGMNTPGRTVVPPSSMQEFRGDLVELEDSDHSNTCKPINKDHRAYRFLVDFIRAIQKEGKEMQH